MVERTVVTGKADPWECRNLMMSSASFNGPCEVVGEVRMLDPPNQPRRALHEIGER
jgi:hypothetical protein